MSPATLRLVHRMMDAADARRACDAATIRALRAEHAAQAALIRVQAEASARERALFEQASAVARIGLWECDLSSESLRWSQGVYDIFEFHRGTQPSRADTLTCYTEDARRTLVAIRAEAIARRSGFTHETQIIGRRGGHRWIRITATVQCHDGVPVRLFGLKQDITDERLRSAQTRYLAEFDSMTGLANRAVFETRLPEIRGAGTLLLIDLDGFKRINDTHGHATGDACLREAARRLRETCRDADLVARIGGDEFAVLIRDDAEGARGATFGHRIVTEMGKPFPLGTESLRFGASVGIARAGDSVTDVFLRADRALYAAKAAGRGTVRSDAPDPGLAIPPAASELEGVPSFIRAAPRVGRPDPSVPPASRSV